MNKLIHIILLITFFYSCKQAGKVEEETFQPSSSQTDGKILYEQNCMICHGNLLTSEKIDVSVSEIKDAISRQKRMAHLGFLNQTQIQNIVNVLDSDSSFRIPPKIINASPYGQYAGATSSLDLFVETDILSKCRYDYLDLKYDQMKYELSSDVSNLNHSKSLPLTAGASYKYFVHCKDLQYGNTTKVSQYIHFSTDLDAPDTTDPVITNYFPKSNLLGGTKNAKIQIDTSESATCRYTRNSNYDYSQMDDMDSTGTLGHSVIVSGLSNGQSYTFYFQCVDPALNESDKQSVTLSVNSITNGGTLYTVHCSSCHGTFSNTSKSGSTKQEISDAIRDVSRMQLETLELLSDEQLQAIEDSI